METVGKSGEKRRAEKKLTFLVTDQRPTQRRKTKKKGREKKQAFGRGGRGNPTIRSGGLRLTEDAAKQGLKKSQGQGGSPRVGKNSGKD